LEVGQDGEGGGGRGGTWAVILVALHFNRVRVPNTVDPMLVVSYGRDKGVKIS